MAECSPSRTRCSSTSPRAPSGFPTDPYLRAKTYEWLFFEQYSHEPYVATVRFWVKYAGKAQEKAQEIVERTARGHAALGVMEKALSATPFLVGRSRRWPTLRSTRTPRGPRGEDSRLEP
jgi:hypothetical protein